MKLTKIFLIKPDNTVEDNTPEFSFIIQNNANVGDFVSYKENHYQIIKKIFDCDKKNINYYLKCLTSIENKPEFSYKDLDLIKKSIENNNNGFSIDEEDKAKHISLIKERLNVNDIVANNILNEIIYTDFPWLIIK